METDEGSTEGPIKVKKDTNTEQRVTEDPVEAMDTEERATEDPVEAKDTNSEKRATDDFAEPMNTHVVERGAGGPLEVNDTNVENGQPGAPVIASNVNAEENKEPTSSTDSAVPEKEDEPKAPKDDGSPPCDWLEPLEDDCDDADAQSFDGEAESIAGSERSGSVRMKSTGEKGRRGGWRPRKRVALDADEGWEDWPSLGTGWKRKEVYRRSGTSEGRSDTYYISPRGDRVRSRVELLKIIGSSMDLSYFEFKTGRFHGQNVRGRKPRKRKAPSPKPLLADTPKDLPKPEPEPEAEADAEAVSPGSSVGLSTAKKSLNSTLNNTITPPKQSSVSSPETINPVASATHLAVDLSGPSKSQPLVSSVSEASNKSVNGTSGPPLKYLGVCLLCKKTHPYEPGETLCPDCRQAVPIFGEKSVDADRSNMTENRSPDSQSPITEDFDESQQSSYLQFSDSEDLSEFLGGIEGDNGMDEMGGAKVRRRSCGRCKGCIRRVDCGTCDFCMDKPKFGGRNKKRQKCRLRQCQREAMRHLLPMELAEKYFGQSWISRRKPRFTYSRSRPRSKKPWNFELLNDAEPYVQNNILQMIEQDQLLHHNYNGKDPLMDDSLSQEDEPVPSITQIFSVAESDHSNQTIDVNHELMPLLRSLRSMILPVLWFCLAVEGPRLQLLQCSKRSTMADTVIHIEPGFRFHISVQKQPLLPSHTLYDRHPALLTSAEEIVTLLLDLERYMVCKGLGENCKPLDGLELVLPERAATCDFLILPEVERCERCQTLMKQ
ncbi:hypothetical protein DNTS_015917 [Danionella cerebrum]|uniref:CXXC-type domain-containing protein n=1 Tax=Danionella cerebrum TaxID=2873325 RepID=A0A553NM79_9TELE|nr:hypothetical protein DNTS_015917 [Danionella translucida]TRY66538.1 hypothetical protein DNTS_015917 [Danionella translucida]